MNEGLLTIGRYAFKGTSLKQASIPKSVTTIEANAFQTSDSYNPVTQITIHKTEGTTSGSPWEQLKQ